MQTFLASRPKDLKSSLAVIGCLLGSLAMTSGAQAATIVEAGTTDTTGDTALYFEREDVSIVPIGTESAASINTRFINWTGRPDLRSNAIGGWIFTASTGLFRLFDGPGQDLVVYEDRGGDEFDNEVNISVSSNGLDFFSINEFFSDGALVADLAGDEVNTNITTNRRGYDLGAAVTALGTSEFSYIRITHPSGGFDFDAVGIRNFREATIPSAVPEPATWAMMLCGFWMVGVALRRRRKSDIALA